MIYDVIVIGGGPAGLAAAISARKENAEVLLIEREGRLGGILKQCIHDGFGLQRFKEKLSGPEYAERFIEEFRALSIPARLWTFVTKIKKTEDNFFVWTVSREGMEKLEARTLILATGCRERTAKQVSIHGTRPAGVYTAGTAQHFTNIQGAMPAKRCVILGSGDIGLIMARRLKLEGAEVLGVYEVKPEPSGLTRNMIQCLDDFGIPLHLSQTVTKVFGDQRLTGVEICQVDEKMQPVWGTEKRIDCDTLILSVGLIPENEIAEGLGISMDFRTKGPICDSGAMTDVSGVFSCGNAFHVNDLVDYVSESGELAGKSAAAYAAEQKGEAPKADRSIISVEAEGELSYVVPQKLRRCDLDQKTVFYFRSRKTIGKSCLKVKTEDGVIYEKTFSAVRPPEMERLAIELKKEKVTGKSIVFELGEVQ